VRGRGTILSPEFQLDGPLLSVLVGGASRRTGGRVELVVDDRVVASASGNDSDFMFPAFWNVSEYQGKGARLRVIDESAGNYVLLDHVLSWR
jgi:levanase